MTATPPEPHFIPTQDHSLPPEPPTVQRPIYQPPAFAPPPNLPPPPDPSARDLAGPPLRRRLSVVRIVCGVLWLAVTLICAAGAVGEFLIGIPGGGVLCLIVAAGSGWYDYRVWTSRSRRLWLIV